jgi:hypothetical protein
VEGRLGSRDAGRNGTRIDGRAGEFRAEEKEGKGDGFGRERGFMLTMGRERAGGRCEMFLASCLGAGCRVLGSAGAARCARKNHPLPLLEPAIAHEGVNPPACASPANRKDFGHQVITGLTSLHFHRCRCSLHDPSRSQAARRRLAPQRGKCARCWHGQSQVNSQQSIHTSGTGEQSTARLPSNQVPLPRVVESAILWDPRKPFVFGPNGLHVKS